MNIYRSTRDGGLYVLSHLKGWRLGGEMQCAPYCWFRGRLGPWTRVPLYKRRDVEKVGER